MSSDDDTKMVPTEAPGTAINESVAVPSLPDVQRVADTETAQLGMFQQLMVGRVRRKIENAHVKQVIQDMFDARYQVIKSQMDEKVAQAKLQISYEGDLARRKMWMRYAEELEVIGRDITKQKVEFAMKASVDAIDNIRSIELSQKPLVDRLMNDLSSGSISQESFDRQADFLNAQRDKQWDTVKSSQNDMLNALDSQFNQAVRSVSSLLPNS